MSEKTPRSKRHDDDIQPRKIITLESYMVDLNITNEKDKNQTMSDDEEQAKFLNDTKEVLITETKKHLLNPHEEEESLHQKGGNEEKEEQSFQEEEYEEQEDETKVSLPPVDRNECFLCHGIGHWARECTSLPKMYLTDNPPVCYSCGGQGHFARVCPSIWRAARLAAEVTTTAPRDDDHEKTVFNDDDHENQIQGSVRQKYFNLQVRPKDLRIRRYSYPMPHYQNFYSYSYLPYMKQSSGSLVLPSNQQLAHFYPSNILGTSFSQYPIATTYMHPSGFTTSSSLSYVTPPRLPPMRPLTFSFPPPPPPLNLPQIFTKASSAVSLPLSQHCYEEHHSHSVADLALQTSPNTLGLEGPKQLEKKEKAVDLENLTAQNPS